MPNSGWVKISCLFFLLFFAKSLFAQEDKVLLEVARAHVDSLTSGRYAGRGYQREGHLRAANYIARQFKAYGLRPFNEHSSDYIQPFSFSVNLVDSASLRINGKKLEIGKYYIVNGGSARGAIKEIPVDVGHGLPMEYKKYRSGPALFRSGLPSKVEKKAALKKKYGGFASPATKVDYAIRRGASAIVILQPKLTASFSRFPYDKPVVEVREGSWPKGKIKQFDLSVSTHFGRVNSQNVIGWVKGATYPDSFLVVSAHYDHLGMQGDAVFAGANDNASGIATLLSLSAYFAKYPPTFSVVFIAFGAEEVGLVGSQFYVNEQPAFPLEATRFVLNLDLMGNGDEGITAVAGADFPDEFKRLQRLNDSLQATPAVKARRNVPNSDHYFFVQAGIPSLFIYTLGGPPHYHDVYDVAEVLRFSNFSALRSLFITFLESFK